MSGGLVERLHDHARNVGGDPSFERLYGSEAVDAADRIEALEAQVVQMREALEQAVGLFEVDPECSDPSTDAWHWLVKARQALAALEQR